jgi:hypothetical protein
MNRNVIAFLGFAAIAAFFLFSEHRAHLFGVLPFAFLLACPLLHVLMHGGHGGHGSHSQETSDEEIASTRPHRHPESPS